MSQFGYIKAMIREYTDETLEEAEYERENPVYCEAFPKLQFWESLNGMVILAAQCKTPARGVMRKIATPPLFPRRFQSRFPKRIRGRNRRNRGTGRMTGI
jgi:hypothetical protein